MITRELYRHFIDCAESRPCCRDMLWVTGGVVIIHTQKKATWNRRDRFETENLPFTVAVIAWTGIWWDIEEKYGSGWTGYTWNRAFFPKPIRFLERLHEKGMRTTLNLHPANGVGHLRKCTSLWQKQWGLTLRSKSRSMRFGKSRFFGSLFYLSSSPKRRGRGGFLVDRLAAGKHHKNRGIRSSWILNHFHFLDHQRTGKRPPPLLQICRAGKPQIFGGIFGRYHYHLGISSVSALFYSRGFQHWLWLVES